MGERKKIKHRRAKGTGCLVNRNGIWYARWTHRGIVHFVSTGFREGEPVTRRDGATVSAKSAAESFLLDRTEHIRVRRREDAIALLIRELQRPSERLKDDLERVASQPTVGDLADLFAASPRRPDCGEAMLRYYRRVAAHLASSVGESLPMSEIDQQAADSYAAKLRGELAPSTYNKALNALALMWRVCAVDCGVLPEDNPWKGITRRRLDTHVRRAFTDAETDRILATATGELRILVATMLYTGMRLGDCVLLRWEDFRNGGVHVTTAKTGAKVAIPVHSGFDAILGVRGISGFVCPTYAKRYLAEKTSHSTVSRSVKMLLEKCGIATSVKVGGRARPDATAHSFRHTFVSRALAAGVPPHVVRAIVGHTNFGMTEHYNHLTDESVLRAFSGMGKSSVGNQGERRCGGTGQ